MPKAVAPFIRLMSGYSVNSCGCWIWNKSKYKSGYGWLKVFGRPVSAHRYSYQLHKGDIPEGMEILHSCDVKLCINPDHLSVGTHKENMAEAKARERLKSGSRHPMFGRSVKKPRQSNVVEVLGKVYESQNKAELSLGLGSGTVKYWIENKPEKAKIIKKGELNNG